MTAGRGGLYAHSLKGRPRSEWQGIAEHLELTAELAERFAVGFAPGWGRVAGLWHDAGKYQAAFQEYLDGDSDASAGSRVDHSTVGALIAKERNASAVAFAIAGHHGGIPDCEDLKGRLQRKSVLLENARAGGLPADLMGIELPGYPEWLRSASDKATFSLWTRFLFSALVDADFLDTERFFAGGAQRELGRRPGLEELRARLEAYVATKTAAGEESAVNEMRARVLAACRAAAAERPGAFTLTVPTGGGKTLASLSFALDHAVRYGLDRVIVVIPFTSIIEQTAEEYRKALGEEVVVEHHSSVDPERETTANRLASENWDAPVVVTTSVQFFESLYANRPGRCRKLHCIARSVVVFDEVQTFPAGLLAPVRRAVEELTSNYGVSVVLCTATQPALLEGAREIIPQPEAEFAAVAGRCRIELPSSEEATTWEALAGEVRGHSQAMIIVHRRDDAQHLAELVGAECLHLSARMCAAHRSVVLGEAKRRLLAGEPCLLVATQLVEAGVDIDFPTVYRAFAGADSMAQAAGRCNREGKGGGVLRVFFAASKPPRGFLQTAQGVARTMWQEGGLDLKAPATFREFFARLYARVETDAGDVMTAERAQQFDAVAKAFVMIPESGEAVVAPYGDWQGRVEEVRRNGISRNRMRNLQRFLVNLYPQEIAQLQAAGAVERMGDAFWAVVPGFPVYSERWGFGWRGVPTAEPEYLIA